MSGWSNLSNELFRMGHNAHQTIWASGAGRISCGGIQKEKTIFPKAKITEKKRNFYKEMPDGPEYDAEGEEPEILEEYSESDLQEAEPEEYHTEDSLLNRDASEEGRFHKKNPEFLQEAVLWSEILGEPVSVKRKRRRKNQFYGY